MNIFLWLLRWTKQVLVLQQNGKGEGGDEMRCGGEIKGIAKKEKWGREVQ